MQEIENAGNHLHNCRGWKMREMENTKNGRSSIKLSKLKRTIKNLFIAVFGIPW